MQSRVIWKVLTTLAVATLTGCGDGSKPTESPALSLTTTSNVIQLVPGQSKSVAFSIARTGGFTGSVNLELAGVP